MSNKKKNKNKNRIWIEYGIIAAVAITLYATGMHTEVIGFAQRGLLATGIMNPSVKGLAQARSNETEMATTSALTPADFNLNLIDEDGNTTSLEELKGKVVFLNMWATWCPPCIAEMPAINKLYKEMGHEVVFVMLSRDEDFETAKAFNKRKGFDLPIYTQGSNLPEMYQSSTIPTTYIIDADGDLALTHEGMANYNTKEFKSFLNSLK